MEPKSEIEIKTVVATAEVGELNGANLNEAAQNQDNLREVTYKRMPQIGEVTKASAPLAENTVRIVNGVGDTVREYSLEIHGENYEALAEKYLSSNAGLDIVKKKQ